MRCHFPDHFPKEENLRFAVYTIQKGLKKRSFLFLSLSVPLLCVCAGMPSLEREHDSVIFISFCVNDPFLWYSRPLGALLESTTL